MFRIETVALSSVNVSFPNRISRVLTARNRNAEYPPFPSTFSPSLEFLIKQLLSGTRRVPFRCSKFRIEIDAWIQLTKISPYKDSLLIRERIQETILLKHPLVNLFTKLLSKVNPVNFFANCFSRITQIQGIFCAFPNSRLMDLATWTSNSATSRLETVKIESDIYIYI